PLFVVFEAKHISKAFDPSDTDGIQKEVKRRLRETCDGTQMSVPWTEERIPQALNRNVKSGSMTPEEKSAKYQTVKDSRYSRWIFICLPGPTGSSSKLFVLIDIVGAELNLEKTSRSAPPGPNDKTF